MKSLESLFHKHMKHFAGLEHEKEAVQGYQVDEEGYGYATDGVQLLRVKIEEPGEYKVCSLSGKLRKDVEPVRLERLLPEYDPVTTVDVGAWLDAAAAFEAVMEKAGDRHPTVELKAVGDDLFLTFDLLDEVAGSWWIGEGPEGLSRHLDGNRLVQCLKVFDGHSDKVKISGQLSRFRPLLLTSEAQDVDVLLLPLRVY